MSARFFNPMEPLPFANKAGESQQSWLDPSQKTQNLSHSYRLFYEPIGADTSRQSADKSGGPTQPITLLGSTRY
ncbi:hypothetical protein VP01_3856g2 [Puccinia sorghi]|uniref:Uncharacterized protein n=1 Tax=Puccinia sorghi TaxID=27349 RepID=A0A0L6UUZ2_9BASI|nr:hypothetical protein VP01_3856g2 [Puccinia sorghi]